MPTPSLASVVTATKAAPVDHPHGCAPLSQSMWCECAGSGRIEYKELTRELKRADSPASPKPPVDAFLFQSHHQPRQSLVKVHNPQIRDALEMLEQQDLELEQVRAGLKLIQGNMTARRIDRRTPQQRTMEHTSMMHDLLYAATSKSKQQALRKFQQERLAPVLLTPAQRGNQTARF
eukprot:1358514-Prymnesium_polylepis.1